MVKHTARFAARRAAEARQVAEMMRQGLDTPEIARKLGRTAWYVRQLGKEQGFAYVPGHWVNLKEAEQRRFVSE